MWKKIWKKTRRKFWRIEGIDIKIRVEEKKPKKIRKKFEETNGRKYKKTEKK